MTLDVTAFTGLGEGIHQVVVTGVTRKIAKAGGDYLRWEFIDSDGKTASANTSVEMTPGNKTGKWFASLTGVPTTVGQSRQIAEVVGKACTIVVEINAEGYPKISALTARQGQAHANRESPVVTAAKAEAIHADQEREAHIPSNNEGLPF